MSTLFFSNDNKLKERGNYTDKDMQVVVIYTTIKPYLNGLESFIS